MQACCVRFRLQLEPYRGVLPGYGQLVHHGLDVEAGSSHQHHPMTPPVDLLVDGRDALMVWGHV